MQFGHFGDTRISITDDLIASHDSVTNTSRWAPLEVVVAVLVGRGVTCLLDC